MKTFAVLALVIVGGSVANFGNVWGADEFSVFPSGKSGVAALDKLRQINEAVFANHAVKKLLNKDSFSALSMVQSLDDKEVQTVKFQQYFKGIEVVGGKVFHHEARNGTRVFADLAQFDLDVSPVLDADQAAALARSYFSDDQSIQAVPELKVWPASVRDGSARLIYWVRTQGQDLDSGRDVLIDAHSGSVIGNLTRTYEIAPIHVYSTMQDGVDLEGCQRVNEEGRPTGLTLSRCAKVVTNGVPTVSADEAALRASKNSRLALEYYLNTHDRNSFDNQGTKVVSLVHVGKKFANAFWSSQLGIMAYGDGDGVRFDDFTKATDVAGHELTHGVVSATANLVYMDEPGALNEAFADFFGKMIADDGDWVVGRKIFITPTEKGIRDLKTPSNNSVCMERNEGGQCVRQKPYPAKVSEQFPSADRCDGDNDYCWVHVNSTVPGHAAYLITQAIGKQKAERLMYLVLTHYLSERADFKIFASESYLACMQTMDSVTCSKVAEAFAQVGLKTR